MNLTDHIAFPYGYQVPLILWFAVAILIILIIIFTINTLQKYLINQYFDSNQGLAIGVCGLLLLISTFSIVDIQETSDWYYVVNNQYITIFNFSESNELSEENLIKYAKVEELIPYLDTRGTHPSFTLKLQDETHFSTIKGNSLDMLAARYFYIHQKNPELLDRTVLLGQDSWHVFDSLLYSLESYTKN